MKKIFYVAGLALALFSSCTDVLNITDPSQINSAIWESESSANLYLNKLYATSMPSVRFGGYSDYSDEAIGTPNALYGALENSSVGDFSTTAYANIRPINVAIAEIEKSSLNNTIKQRILGQATFLRAWSYFELVKLYGGVPLVLSAQDPNTDDLNVPRSKTSECIAQIVKDLDISIAGLPEKWTDTDYGRITKGAAAAFKGRVLLYWASPQFNPNKDLNRWQAAYDANKFAKEICIVSGDSLNPSFDNIFLQEGSANKEAILVRVYSRDIAQPQVHTWENSIRPLQLGIDGGQSSNPTYDLFEAFPMKNGLSITDGKSGYSTTYFWKNRDPRFYATIAYNGSRWDYLRNAGDTVWTYTGNNWEPTAQQVRGSGFYCRKASNPSISKTLTKETGTDWIEIRLAEVLMNLAECANETGKPEEAYDVLKAVRKRAGIEPGSEGLYGLASGMSGETMRSAILKERFIEFAFENKRYWDLRRHMLFTTDIAGYLKLNGRQRKAARIITRVSSAIVNANRGSYNLETTYGTYFRDIVSYGKESEGRTINYLAKYYFFDIPKAVMDRCPAIQQTSGWDGYSERGYFDPLAE